MAFIVPPRVLETGTGSGSGSITLSGAQGTGQYDAFADHLSAGDTTIYVAVDGSNFEIGYGTLSNSTTLTRDTVIRSSNASGTPPSVTFSKISLSGDSMNVFSDVPNEKILLVGPDGTVTNVTAVAASVLPKDLASIKALSAPADNTIVGLGYGTTEGDGLGGMFRWDETSTAAADDIHIIQSDERGASAGRWIRERQSLFLAERASDPTNADEIVRRSDTHNIRSNRSDTGVKTIPEVQNVARAATYATLSALKVVASSNWKQGDIIELRGVTAEGDVSVKVGTWQASSTNTDALDETFVRPDDISGSNPGRFQFPFDINRVDTGEVLDEDDFSSDSATSAPSQQSVAAYVSKAPNVVASTELTIASGSITLTGPTHTVDTEGDAAADDLTDITWWAGVRIGDTCELTAANVARVVTIKSATGAGKIKTDSDADIALDKAGKTVRIRWDGIQTQVIQGFNGASSLTLNAADYGMSTSATASANATALQSAIDVAEAVAETIISNGYSVVSSAVVIPPGEYNCDPVTIMRCWVFAAERNSVSLKSSGAQTLVTIGGTGAEASGNAGLRNITLLGDWTGGVARNGTVGSIGIQTNQALRQCRLEQCAVIGFGTGIKLNNTYGFRCEDTYVLAHSEYCIDIINGTATHFIGGRIEYSAGHGIRVRGPAGGGAASITLTLKELILQNHNDAAIRIEDSSDVYIKDCYLEGNNDRSSGQADHISIAGQTVSSTNYFPHVSIENVYITTSQSAGSTSSGIGASNVDNLILKNVWIQDSNSIIDYGVQLGAAVQNFVWLGGGLGSGVGSAWTGAPTRSFVALDNAIAEFSGLKVRKSNGDAIFDVQSDNSTSNAALGLISGGGTGALSKISFGDPDDSDVGYILYNHTSDYLSFAVSASERERILSSGIHLYGKTASDSSTAGVEVNPSGVVTISRASNVCMLLNQTTTEGPIIDFRTSNSSVGTITISSGSPGFTGAHLSRMSQSNDGYEDIPVGTVMANLDEMCIGEQDNSHLNKTCVSTLVADRNVAGVFQGVLSEELETQNHFEIAHSGDFRIRIAADVNVEIGDLLESAGDGTARPQKDDLIRSSTIAKVNATHRIETYDDGSYLVPCNLMCA